MHTAINVQEVVISLITGVFELNRVVIELRASVVESP